MRLFYDPRDDRLHEKLGSQILYWLDDVGACPLPLNEAHPDDEGFLFAGARPIEDYRALVAPYPLIRDRPDEREPLLRLDTVLQALDHAGVQVPSPRTWLLRLDEPLPEDLTFPLFLRTAESSWKKGGRISRVNNSKQLEAEAAELGRALGWDATILAREWLDLAPAGRGVYGPIPQEIRTWIVDGVPFAWSFHYLGILAEPSGFPPTEKDLTEIAAMSAQVGLAFHSRLIVADFARDRRGAWWLIEAGPGSCAGTAHEVVFKAVGRRLLGDVSDLQANGTGGPLRLALPTQGPK